MKRRYPSLALSKPSESIWRDYECVHGREVILDELETIATDAEGWTGPLPQKEIEVRLGELDAVIERARFGELVEGEELKPVSADPELWEIRARMNGKQVRIYHAEPQIYVNLMVGLRAHFKWVDGTQGEIDKVQNTEISRATKRFHDGQEREWRCVDPEAEPCPLDSPC
ncbi:hypothetical protein ACIQC0_08575 [Pseudarthrobacter sp. NPDC092419]|uniref:hypothetical protein n=1 Tax=Pseudarthrobacter sp. NPDC092419 TaxID=3364414 RepID=UPI00381574EA